ncbi:uncharacterized protein LOC119789026 [Cyprinodon tularosa]|uniref:uncharacterized protein LOC119789026 n=1 Tax=Cyprinodon tularosa TaxID=77115 RepID=UPI0018E20A1B|nr:uncharacterized protein LOC119789026 [Cyprinodon tularosa]
MVWDGISLEGCTGLQWLTRGSMILRPLVRPYAGAIDPGFGVCQRFLQDEGIQAMDWPVPSLNLNLTEHIWDIMSRSIHITVCNVAPQTVQELVDALVQVWEDNSHETIRHLIRSMPRGWNPAQHPFNDHISVCTMQIISGFITNTKAISVSLCDFSKAPSNIVHLNKSLPLAFFAARSRDGFYSRLDRLTHIGVRVDRDDDRSQAGTITEECQAQHSPPSSVPSEEGSEASEQDDDPDPEQPEPEDVSSTAFAPSKGPSDISTSRKEVPVQPHLSKYPKTLHGTSKRAFNSKWYTNNSWLEYSVSKNSCYCFACRHFSLPNAPDSAFTSDVGFSNWKKALSKEAGFKLHSRSELHINAMYAWSEFKKRKEVDQTLLNALNEKHKKRYKKTGSTSKQLQKYSF